MRRKTRVQVKSELIWPGRCERQTAIRCQAENAVARYIDGFYNPIRRHSTLGYQDARRLLKTIPRWLSR